MILLAIDGNSLINRAFYGIKALNARDGHFTNALHGFMTTFLNLTELTSAQAVAVAFDVREPTFRHKMYDAYKAGRKPMPPELFEQMEPLKELLRAYGCHIVECPGFEADDILGTLSANCKAPDKCYIATGDRDSLQLVSDNTTVLLTTTKMGKTVTSEYTPEKLFEEYGVSPEGMIEIKALQGDSSDNIPGVQGIGPKTAGDLIKKYSTIENIYDSLDTLEVSAGVKAKLEKGKESAFFSKTLGTICKTAPVESAVSAYALNERDDEKLLSLLSYHELFKIIAKLKLSPDKPKTLAKRAERESAVAVLHGDEDFDALCKEKRRGVSCIFENGELTKLAAAADGKCVVCDGTPDELADKLVELISTGEAVVFDSKQIYSHLIKHGKAAPERLCDDIKLAAYLLDPNAASYGVLPLSLSYNISCPEFPADEGDAAVIKETLLLLPLADRLLSALESNSQEKLYLEIELPLALVLAEAEIAGMAVTPKAILDYADVLQANADELQEKIYELAGERFNINSPKQLGVILFEKLGLPCKKKTKTGYSTDADVLEELSQTNEIAALIIRYRTFAKLKSTYCDGLYKAIAPDGRIHCSFNQTETRTGRLSSTDPNLQNIPVRTPEGREFRKFFTAADGCMIIDADYSQIELRVLAAMADDKNMINAFNNNEDIHTVTAAKVFGVPESEVTPTLRSRAKAVNFGIVYGIGAFSLSKDIHSTRAEAESFINSYLALYSSVDSFMKNCIESAKQLGYAQTLFNRRRYLPELNASNHAVRSFGERVARNMPIQGTAADIIKIAMIKVSRRLKRELPEARLIMQVHDELIVEAPEKLSQKAADILKEEMENAVKLSVTLKADVGIGKTWYDAKG